MHKLLAYICDEMEELERKAEKGGKLSMQEIQYLDTLAHTKKNILTADAMEEAEEYSGDYSGARMGRGRGSNARRDSMGRYSSEYGRSYGDRSYRGGSYEGRSYRGYSRDDAKGDLMEGLRELEADARDEESRHMVKKWIKQLEQG